MRAEKRKAYCAAYRADPKNKARAHALRKARYAADPESHAAAQRHRYYGLSPEKGKALFAAQGKKCAICKTDKPRGRGAWHLDHDHSTGELRGFLCQQCNTGLGNFQDNTERMEAAAAYLRRYGILSVGRSSADKA